MDTFLEKRQASDLKREAADVNVLRESCDGVHAAIYRAYQTLRRKMQLIWHLFYFLSCIFGLL